ncbi:MAG: DNRLRE domain-containing protein, partial [Oscillospiraceae bacterium]
MKLKKGLSFAMAVLLLAGLFSAFPALPVQAAEAPVLKRAAPAGAAPQTQAADIESGLVLYSNFEEVQDETVPDLSGKGNHGAVTGGVAFAPGSGVGGQGMAAYIENANKRSPTQYINFGSGESLRLGTGDFSVSLWVKFKEGNYNHDSSVFSQRDYNSGTSVGFTLGNQAKNAGVGLVANIGNGKGQRRERQGILALDGAWHHVVVSVSRLGEMVTYMDGGETAAKWQASSAAMANFSASLDAGLPWVLGADGKFDYGSTALYADNLRLYSRALAAEDVACLYASEGAAEAIAALLAKVEAAQPGEFYSRQDIEEAAQKMRDCLAALAGKTPAEAAAILAQAQQAYEAFLTGPAPGLSFALISDVHINNTAEANAAAFVSGLKDMQTLGLDAFVNVGDNTDYGQESEISAFYQLYNANQPVDAGRAIHLMGNHEVRGNSASSYWTNSLEEYDANAGGKPLYYQTAVQLYQKYNGAYMPKAEDRQNQSYATWINGYRFIVLNTDKGLKDACWFSDETMAWLEAALAEAAEAGKPVFVVNHQQLEDTHWRSNILSGFGARDAEMKTLFARYPQVVYLTGHIHNGFGVAEAVSRPFGTMVEVPSYNESENGEKSRGLGYVVNVHQGAVRLRARNFVTGTWLSQYDITLQMPSLPEVCGQAAAKTQAGYTAASWQAFSAARGTAQALLEKTYDQSVITAWNDVRPPAEALYGAAAQAEIKAAAVELKAALEGLMPEEGEKQLPPLQDVYLQAGPDADKPATGSTGSPYNEALLKVKTSDGQQNYTRKTLLTFALGEASAALNGARLVLRVADVEKNPGPHFTGAQVYAIPSSWQAGTATWNSTLYTGSRSLAADIIPTNIEGGVLTVDVSGAVAEALQKGESKISFELSIAAQANDNKLEFYSSRQAGNTGPALVQYNKGEAPGRVEDPAFRQVRLAWAEYLTGGDFNQNDPGLKGYVEALDETAQGYWQSMNKSAAPRTLLWSDLETAPMAGTGEAAKVRSGNISTTYYRLRDLALAYSIKGTGLYQNPAVREEVIKGLDFMYANSYNTTNAVFGNWWHWDIGTPIASLTSTLLLYDFRTDAQLYNYTAAVNRYCPTIDKTVSGAPVMKGANLIDKGTAVALNAVLTQNPGSMEHVKARIKTVFAYVTAGDGFYQDGSYIQHQALSFMGAYGKDLYTQLSIFFVTLKSSPWQLSYEDGCEKIPFDMIFEGVEPFFYNGLYMDMVSGRDIVRQNKTDKRRGVDILAAILPMGQAMPTEEMQSRFN